MGDESQHLNCQSTPVQKVAKGVETDQNHH